MTANAAPAAHTISGPCFIYCGVSFGCLREYFHLGTGSNFTVLIDSTQTFAGQAEACRERFENSRPQDEMIYHVYATSASERGPDWQRAVRSLSEGRAACREWFGREI